jgi:hypothetical protein
MFTWEPHGGGYVLTYRLAHVARLECWPDGQWRALLYFPRRPLESGPYVRLCRSEETGRAGIETWAERHRNAIVRWIDADYEDFHRAMLGTSRANAEKSHRPSSSGATSGVLL